MRLDVFVNGRSLQLIIAATRLANARIAVARSELEEVGIKAPGDGARDEQIDLDGAGLRYRYDEAGQRIYFDLSDEQRMPKIYDGRGERPAPPPAMSAWGALINYSTFASASSKLGRFAPDLNGVNASIDARLFSPYGLVTQTGAIGDTQTYDLFRFGRESGLRLDTTYSYADSENLLMYNAGDVITAGFQWTRPVRLGGLQAQRNFALRADLVTTPTPFVSGSAAVPSTVDVFVNGSKTYSQQVGEGPFNITNLPISTSDGHAEVVIRDAFGRETRQELSLFSGQNLIAAGQADFSLELGVARRYYNLRSFDYDRRPVGSGSVRYGVTDRVTAKAHAEGGAALVNLGGGVAMSFGRFGNLEVALSGSRRTGPTLLNGWRNGVSVGGQAFASYALATPFGVGLSVSAQQTIGNYEDLASTTAQFAWNLGAFAPTYLSGSFTGVDIYPPRAVYRLSASARVYGIGGTASVALGRITRVDSLPAVTPKNSTVVSASYSRDLPFDGSLFVTAYADLSGSAAGLAYPYRRGPNVGLFAGVSFPLGDEKRASVGVQSVPNPTTGKTSLGANAQVQKSMGGDVGSYGWSLNATQGETPLRGGSATYRSPVGVARVSGLQQGKLANGTAQFDGAIAVTDAGVVAGPPVLDSFAVVSAGAPDVAVLQDNRVVGRTNMFGKLLVPTLRSYARNKIAIDPNSLPTDAIPTSTEEVVAPKHRSGVGVDFGVETSVRSALLVLTGPDGKFIETGRRGRVEGGDSFVVGYDGRAYLRRLSQTNTIIVDLGEKDCRATFDYDSSTGPNHAVKATCE